MSIWCAVIIGLCGIIAAAILGICITCNGAVGLYAFCDKFMQDPDKYLGIYADACKKTIQAMEELDN